MTFTTKMGKGAKTAALSDMKYDRDVNVSSDNEVIEYYFREDIEVRYLQVNSIQDWDDSDMDSDYFLD